MPSTFTSGLLHLLFFLCRTLFLQTVTWLSRSQLRCHLIQRLIPDEMTSPPQIVLSPFSFCITLRIYIISVSVYYLTLPLRVRLHSLRDSCSAHCGVNLYHLYLTFECSINIREGMNEAVTAHSFLKNNFVAFLFPSKRNI